MIPHKHADLIKNWADGAEIQFKYPDDTWENVCGTPTWASTTEYRIKPKNIVSYVPILISGRVSSSSFLTKECAWGLIKPRELQYKSLCLRVELTPEGELVSATMEKL